MHSNELIGLETADTEAEPSITRAIDLSTTQCVEARGGDVVFARIVERTDDGAALARTGEDIPVLTTSVYSAHELRAALQAAGYQDDHIESALSLTLEGERGRQVAHLAESRTRDHPAQIERDDSDATGEGADAAIATDGGDESCEWCGEIPAAGSQRKLHDELPDEVDADVLCTSCILDDTEDGFADTRDVMTDGGTATRLDAADYRRQVERETDGGQPDDDRCEECGRRTELPDDHDERELHTADCSHLGGTVDPYADEREEVDSTPL